MKKNKGLIAIGIILSILVIFILSTSLGIFKFTVTDFRIHYSSSNIIQETEEYRCVEYWQLQETIPINAKLSIPPASSLKSIEIPVDYFDRTNLFTECFATVNVNSKFEDVITSYDKNTIKPCISMVPIYGIKLVTNSIFCQTNNCYSRDDYQYKYLCDSSINSGQNCELDFINNNLYVNNKNNIISYSIYFRGNVYNPLCPVNYFVSKDYYTLTYQGRIFFDAEIDNFVCKINIENIPYTCFSDTCQGKDMFVKEGRACISTSESKSEEAYNIVFNKLIIEQPTPVDNITEEDIIIEEDIEVFPDINNEVIKEDFINKIIKIFKSSKFTNNWKYVLIGLSFIVLSILVLTIKKK